MATDNDGVAATTAERAQRLARLLRHEVGDLLQSVYSTVAVLTERLPATLQLERRLVADLKNRAELCKGELDAAVSLVVAQAGASERVDLSALVGAVLTQVQKRFPALPVQFSARQGAFVLADGRNLSGALWLLLVAVCQSAQKRVEVGVEMVDGQIECRVERDGYPATQEQLAWLERPFATTHHAVFGLGLALLQQSVQPGGEVRAANRPDGGIGVCVRFPSA
jgi:C4-dicarboxylate-specific signal transduction histidine kinase